MWKPTSSNRLLVYSMVKLWGVKHGPAEKMQKNCHFSSWPLTLSLNFYSNKIFTSYSSLCVLLLVWVWFWCLVYFKSYGSLYDALLFQRLHIFRSLNPYNFWISSQKGIIPQIPILWLSLKTLKKLQAFSVSSDKIMGDQKRAKNKKFKIFTISNLTFDLAIDL